MLCLNVLCETVAWCRGLLSHSDHGIKLASCTLVCNQWVFNTKNYSRGEGAIGDVGYM